MGCGPTLLYNNGIDRSQHPEENAPVGATGTSKAFSGRASRPGTYVCNAVFYTLMDAVNHTIPAGFIHVPKTMETSRVTQALGTAVQIALSLSSCSDHSCYNYESD